MVVLTIAGLDDGTHAFELEPSAEDLDIDPKVFKKIVVDAAVDKNGPTIVIDFEVSATATMECARTLDEFDDRIKGTYRIVASPARRSARHDEEEADPTDYEYVTLDHEQERIDITTAVRDTLLLAVPIRPLSPQGKAAEIQLSYGKDPADEGIDPRWEALRSLRQQPE